MRGFRCPWCGEEAISFVFIGRTRGLDRYSVCPNCHKAYKYAKKTERSEIVFYMILLLILAIIALVIYFFPIPGLLLLILTVPLIIYFLNRMTAIIRYDRDAQCELPFSFPYFAKVTFYPARQSGYRFRKLFFKSGTILGAKFRTKIEKFNNFEMPVVFDAVQFEGNSATCRFGFVMPERISENFLHPQMEFTLIDNGREIAKGVVTGGYFEQPKTQEDKI